MASAVPHRREVDASPLGVALATAGFVATTVATFLPEANVTNSDFDGINNNTLIQSGDGFVFIGLALVGLLVGFRAYRRGQRSVFAMAAGALVVGAAILDGRPSQLRYCDTLAPTLCQTGSPGVGLYLAGLGGAFLIIGALYLRTREPALVLTRALKRCPDCAEDVLVEARVCKHCGYRFGERGELPPSLAATGLARIPREAVVRTGADAVARTALLSFLIVCVIAAAAYLPMRLAGNAVFGIVVALIVEVALLSRLTLEAYPYAYERHRPTWVLASFILTPVIPVVWLTWLAVTKKRWPSHMLRT